MPAFMQENKVVILLQFAIIVVFLHDLNQMFNNCWEKSNFISFCFAVIFPRPQLCHAEVKTQVQSHKHYSCCASILIGWLSSKSPALTPD